MIQKRSTPGQQCWGDTSCDTSQGHGILYNHDDVCAYHGKMPHRIVRIQFIQVEPITVGMIGQLEEKLEEDDDG